MKLKKIIGLFVTILIVVLLVDKYILVSPSYEISKLPNGKKFAFTMTDDTDGSTLESIKPIYDFLLEKGLFITKTCWVLGNDTPSGLNDAAWYYGDTTEREDYLTYLKYLQKRGFEIALHTASGGNDTRERTIKGYEVFKEQFGDFPKMNISHFTNLENIYWGAERFPYPLNLIMQKFFYKQLRFQGDDKTSPYFWGDICQQRTKYIRGFSANETNLLKINASMPYHEPSTPYVNYWFSCTNGLLPDQFISIITRENVDKLENERGVCIVYTHLGMGFAHKHNEKYIIDDRFKKIMEYVTEKDGWFAPASTVLDRLLDLKKVKLYQYDDRIVLINEGREFVDGVTLWKGGKGHLFDTDGNAYVPNESGDIVVGDMHAFEVKVLFKDHNSPNKKMGVPLLEKVKIYFYWIFTKGGSG
jgi:hypothetical protein